VWACAFCGLFALPLGIATAVFLEEFRPTGQFLRFLQSLIQLNITNLAGVPSIVYGILGLTAFATMFGLFGSDKDPYFRFGGVYYYQYLSEGMYPVLVPVAGADQVPELVDGMAAEDGDHNPVQLRVIGPDEDLPEDPAELQWTIRSDAVGGVISEKPWYYFQVPFGRGVLAAALTLMLVILPVIIIASQEAIKAVPSSLREGAMGLGATRWQVVKNVTLPAAIPGIMTGAILSISLAIGEAAPLVVLCGVVYIAQSPQHLMDFVSVLPIQIFYLTGMPPADEALISFQNVAAAASLVLLIVLLSFNTIAILLRQFTSKPLS
jgi:phosphate transport system permease protein